MTCRTCGADLAQRTQVCPACGTPTGVSCWTCGAIVPPDAHLCSSCGAQRPADSLRTSRERKIATVVFADLVGFTSLNERLDPEHVATLVDRAFQRLSVEA